MTGGIELTSAELTAVERVVQAEPGQLRAALRRLPSYQRQSVRWLARELGDLGVTRPGSPAALRRVRAFGLAILEHQALQGAIDQSAATPEQKALLGQHLAHLWAYFEQALRECRAVRDG